MTLRMKAFISGVVIEGILFALIFSGMEVYNPYKPGRFDLVFTLLHYPALVWGPQSPEWLAILLTAACGVIAWGVIIYAILWLIRLGRKHVT